MEASQGGSTVSNRLERNQSFSLHANRQDFGDDFDDEMQNEKEDEQGVSSTPSPSSVILGRIKNGNALDILAISVIIFFLATVWLSGGRLLNDSTSTNNSVNQGKTRVYKYVDAEKLLQEDFDRESSKVIF